MNPIQLSYVLTTYNKLSYLQVTLPMLLASRREDEEIVIVDGGSSDGTKEYLQQLFTDKKIDQFISEKDAGEAHGTNKAMLMARGVLIKIITDDDVFYYPCIQACKQFMLKNTQLDLMGFDGFGYNINHEGSSFQRARYIHGFEEWRSTKTPFLLCGLSYLFRKSSLAYMGLFDTSYTMIDIEYSIRVSSMKTKIGFYTGLGYVNIVNPSSNSFKYYEVLSKEKIRLTKTYPHYKNKITAKGSLIKLKDAIAGKVLKKRKKNEIQFNYQTIVSESQARLEAFNKDKHFEFLT